jgi:hypothetical protein
MTPAAFAFIAWVDKRAGEDAAPQHARAAQIMPHE